MSIDYDAWLQEPYQQACRDEDEWEQAENYWLESDDYLETIDRWLEENPDKTEDDFRESKDYESGIEWVIRGWYSRDEEW